jgi:hypothetical protein
MVADDLYIAYVLQTSITLVKVLQCGAVEVFRSSFAYAQENYPKHKLLLSNLGHIWGP